MSVSTLINAQWLRQMMLQKTKYLRVLDTSWHLPNENRDPKKEFLAHRIPGSKFFDIEECVDKSSPYEHMLPNAEDFSNYVRSLGLKNDSHVVVYDNNNGGLFSAPRVWWMLRAFGHDRVSILDGGLAKWCAENYPVESGPENAAAVEGGGRGAQLIIPKLNTGHWGWGGVVEVNLPGRCSLGSSRVLSRLQGASVWEPRVGLASCDNGVPSAPLFWVYKQL